MTKKLRKIQTLIAIGVKMAKPTSSPTEEKKETVDYSSSSS